MQDVRLTVKKRAFPSHGRVRLNAAVLSDLDIGEGGRVDLVNEHTKKSVHVTVIADTMVPRGEIRVSGEDLESLGLSEGADVLVKKTPPLTETLSKTAAEANAVISAKAQSLENAAKTTVTQVKKESKKISDKVGKAASKTANDVKKSVNKMKTKERDL